MTDTKLDQVISDWLEAEAPTQVPDRVLSVTFDRTRKARQRAGWGGLPRRWSRPRFAPALASAAILLVVAVGALGVYFNQPGVGVKPSASASALPSASPSPITGSLPAEQIAVVARQVAALNGRDVAAFVEVFAANGAFNPRGTFMDSSVKFSHVLPISDLHLLEPFMAINDAWGFEAEVMTCDVVRETEVTGRYSASADLFARCAVKSRWSTLSLEIGEWWVYEFRGAEIVWWSQTLRDAAPADRGLPLGLGALLHWEAWLHATDPDAAARLLNPRVYPATVPCGPPDPPCEWTSDNVDVERIESEGYGFAEHEWTVAGRRFSSGGLIPYDPAHAHEIEASIKAFLGRSPSR